MTGKPGMRRLRDIGFVWKRGAPDKPDGGYENGLYRLDRYAGSTVGCMRKPNTAILSGGCAATDTGRLTVGRPTVFAGEAKGSRTACCRDRKGRKGKNIRFRPVNVPRPEIPVAPDRYVWR